MGDLCASKRRLLVFNTKMALNDAVRELRGQPHVGHLHARQPQIPRYRLDRLPTGVLAPNPNYCLHHQHPDLATWKTRPLSSPSEWWFPFARRSTHKAD